MWLEKLPSGVSRGASPERFAFWARKQSFHSIFPPCHAVCLQVLGLGNSDWLDGLDNGLDFDAEINFVGGELERCSQSARLESLSVLGIWLPACLFHRSSVLDTSNNVACASPRMCHAYGFHEGQGCTVWCRMGIPRHQVRHARAKERESHNGVKKMLPQASLGQPTHTRQSHPRPACSGQHRREQLNFGGPSRAS